MSAQAEPLLIGRSTRCPLVPGAPPDHRGDAERSRIGYQIGNVRNSRAVRIVGSQPTSATPRNALSGRPDIARSHHGNFIALLEIREP
jgi:hypothetical protein